ncbi:exopolyphosphatase PRUNE1 isoform X1 [Dendrobium catenatum]|uniref:Exopolyphosphatase n=1 Tax=Dendrobium catenatum TaxID=906689 RepID=A0A2I0WCE4_9ASPA|nr:exopolyphosphatase PRUNE1 isoform X1 [Dendrobium catenatum]PKU73317.1 exopolyphosphatase [Dendrobium catenatum]
MINAFLRRQRATIGMASDGEVSVKAKIVLSSYTPDTSSMVAAICYAWLLENTRKREKSKIKDEVVVPVINMRRARMWEHKQAAWLFHHIGIDASALIFSDELDLEGLLMGKQLSLLIVGQDVLQTNGEVGSLCTILTDNYCEDAYDLLQTSNLRRLLLAGILLDTQNLSSLAKSSTNRDAEAVQLLLVGSSPDYRDFFFKQVMKEHGEEYFLESMRQHYGKLPVEVKQKPSTAPTSGPAAVQPTPALAPAPSKPTEKPSCTKNKFSVGRFFNFFS